MSVRPTAKLCRAGTWVSGGSVRYAFVTCQAWDYYFDEYTEGEADLGPDGLAYYALFGDGPDWQLATSRSPTCLTESEAAARAEALVGPVQWRLPTQ